MGSKKPYEVFQRKDSANWWMRFSLSGQGQVRLGLKTANYDEAIAKAATEYQRAQFKAEHNLLPGKMSFDRVAGGFLDSIEADKSNPKAHATYVAHKGVLDRYLIPYFTKKPIAAITEPNLYAYVDWRTTYWTTGPGKNQRHIEYERGGRKLLRPVKHEEPKLATLRREAVTLRAVMSFAARNGFITRAHIPKLELGKEPSNKRPAFTSTEISTLLSVAEQRVAEMSRHPKLQYERLVLFCFVAIAVC